MDYPQKDDGHREALSTFKNDRDKNVDEFLRFCVDHGQYWKARVFLEILWEYEDLKFRMDGLEK